MRSVAAFPLAFVVLVGSACGGDGGVGFEGEEVGGACRDHADCADTCLKTDKYPGMCSMSCRDDGDCPEGTRCVDDESGICAVECRVHRDCEEFGSRWVCDERNRKGASGKTDVCRAD